jgi:hypothetical protein
MKSLAGILLLASATVFGQTNEFIPIFTTDGRVYTNARITSVTASYVIVMFDGGGKKVKVEDLPEPFRTQYYNPEKAAKLREQEERARSKRLTEYATASETIRQAEASYGEEQTEKVVKISGLLGKCYLETSEDTKEVFINGLPKSVSDYFAEYDSLDSQVTKAIDSAKRAADESDEADARAPAFVSGSAAFVQQESAKMERAKLLRVEADKRHGELIALERKQSVLMDSEKRRTTILARPTGKIYGGLRIWEFRGFPKPKQKRLD